MVEVVIVMNKHGVWCGVKYKVASGRYVYKKLQRGSTEAIQFITDLMKCGVPIVELS